MWRSPTRLTISLLFELRSESAARTPLENYCCVSPILVIAFELQQRDTSLVCIYLLPITSFFFYLSQASLNKSSRLPHSYTNTTSDDDPVQYSRSVKPDFWLYYSNKVLHCILRQQNSMWQTNVSYLVSLTTRTCKIPGGKKRRQKKESYN